MDEPIDVRGLSRDDYRAAKAALRSAPVAPTFTTEQRRELIARDLAEMEAGGARIGATEAVAAVTAKTPAPATAPINVRDMDDTVYAQYKREYLTRNRRK
jgi:hypothetical protein